LFAQNTGIVFFTKCVQHLNLERPLSVLCSTVGNCRTKPRNQLDY